MKRSGKKLGAQARAFLMLGAVFILIGVALQLRGMWILGLIFFIMAIVSRFLLTR